VQPLSLSERPSPSPPIFVADDTGGRDLVVVKEQSGSCGDRGFVRIELSPECGERGLGRDNIGVEVWCGAIVRAVADAMVHGWRRGGGLPERPGAALGLKRESEPFTLMQKHMLLVA